MSTYLPRGWEKSGIYWPLCPPRAITEEEYAAIVSIYGESFAEELYARDKNGDGVYEGKRKKREAVKDGNLSTETGTTGQTD